MKESVTYASPAGPNAMSLTHDGRALTASRAINDRLARS